MVARWAAVVLLLAGCSWSDDGPVEFEGEGPSRSTAGIHADAGDRVVFGATMIRNTGDRTATLTAGDLTGDGSMAGGARIVEVRARDLASGSDLVGAAYWPFEDYEDRSVALNGFRLEAGAEAELLFVVQVEKTGQWYWPETAVRYDSEGQSYQEVLNVGFHICPRDDDVCKTPEA
jgi:hypothetical protein